MVDGRFPSRFVCLIVLLRAAMICLGLACGAHAQTASTGALSGVTKGPSGAALPGVNIELRDVGGEMRSSTSDNEGRFAFPLLPPGTYRLRTDKKDFQSLQLNDLHIAVTESRWIELHLQLPTMHESVEAVSEPALVQTASSALGRVVNETTVTDLPLVTRNFSQIAGLSPGVTVGVYNAGELGIGGTALSQIAKSNDGIFVRGARSYDNNFQLDGISTSDVQGSSGSGGIPVPNPDTIEEFKVQTGLYDAAYGRYAGANVSVITKISGNQYHGTVFEFLRNNLLNANDFFLNNTGQARPDLKQNQFGFTFGGPLKKEKLFFFGSYQGTRQINGLAAGQARIACKATLNTPPLTNDRSAAALGKLFGGMSGAFGGIAVDPNGSNINPVALTLLNFKLANGDYLIPTPQNVDPSKPFAQQGLSTLTEPCHFSEDQVLANADYLASAKSRFTERFFLAKQSQTATFPGNGLNPSGNIPGFPSAADSDFTVFSLANTYAFSSNWLNEVRVGYVRTRTDTHAISAFRWSDVGVSEGQMSENNDLPSLSILGSVSVASGFPRNIAQNSFVFDDTLSFVRDSHTVRLGGSLTRVQNNLQIDGLGSFVQFLSWPDFLLGLNAAGNGSPFSNVFSSFDVFGLTDREYRAWEGSAFLQDDYRISRSMTINIGLRYERLGQFADSLGRNSSFDFTEADPNPPPGGSLAGYLVASNFPGAVPPGVRQVHNPFGNYADGQNTIAPRLGFAWQIFHLKVPFVLRGGYGTYYSRTTGQAFYQNVFGAPFSEFRLNTGAANTNATFQEPFPRPFPTPDSFPMFPVYSPDTTTTVYSIAPNFRPALIQQFSLNVQAELRKNWLLEIGYVGTRGTRLMRQRSLNQAFSASASNPIRGVTTNTLANVSSRVPILGIPPDSLQEMESEGRSWYNGLEISLTKRLSHGLQFLASYTFSKTLDTDGADINSTSSGNGLTLGDQNSPAQRWGPSSIDRPQRLVFSTTWALPSPQHGWQRTFLGAWDLAGVLTIQSGTALTIAYTNANNVFGISEDRAELSGACSKSQLVTSGSIGSKLNNYLNRSCFTTPPVIGADGIATAFGNSGTGIVDGPGQANVDLALSKTFAIKWPTENGSLQVRAELFNALNHPQFANPDSNFSSPTFGVIASTSVNPRIIQLAMRWSF